MGNCFSTKPLDEHNLYNEDEFKSSTLQLKCCDETSNTSFRKSLKKKPSTSLKPKDDSFTKEAANAIISSKPKSSEDLALINNSLNKHFIFKNLTKEQRSLIMQEMKYYYIPVSSLVLEQGRPGKNFFVISSGKVEILVNDVKVNTLNQGDSFGEMALLQDKPRSASVRSLGECTLWGVDRITFRKAVQAINASNYEQNKYFIETVPLFKVLTKQQKELMLSSISSVNYSEGEKIVNEGETGDLFYLIKEGTVMCTREGNFLRNMGAGEYFGEQALLYKTPRTATITSVSESKCLVIGREDLTLALGSQLSQIIYKNSIRMAFDKSQLAKRLSDTQIKTLASSMSVLSFSSDSVVIKKNTPKNQFLYVMVNGKLRNSQGAVVAEIFNLLGEQEIENPSSESYEELIAIGRVDIACISFGDFNGIIGGSYNNLEHDNKVLSVFKKVSLFRGLSEERLKSLVGLLKLQEYQEKENIFLQDSPGDAFFIIKSGRVDIIKNENLIRTINIYDYFGERSILFNETRTATVRAKTKVICWVLHKSDFFRIIDEKMRAILQKRIELQDDNITLDDLVVVKKIGQGMFGNVFLTSHVSKKNLYALKTINRSVIENEKVQDSLLLEKKILMQLDHIFILKLIKTFKDDKRLYFLLEYVKGQDLFDVIRELGLVTEEDSRFYASCLIVIFEYLHERDIVYRDLKPENVMIDEEGYPKLIDFGTSKIVQGRTYTMIGTPHYMAPEVILGKGYGASADYWSLGIMIFEFICGIVPFGDSDIDSYTIYEKVLEGQIVYPSYAKPTLESKIFIEQLLNKNPALRTGGSFENLKSHMWLKHVNWEHVIEKKAKAPYVPITPSLEWEIQKSFKNMRNISNVIATEEKFLCKGNLMLKNKNWDEEF